MAWDDTKVAHVSPVAAADYNALVTYLKTRGKIPTRSATAPSSPTDGDLWYDTTTGSEKMKLRVSGAWVDLTLSGPTGPQGPAGADGATGATGPQGPAGESGSTTLAGLDDVNVGTPVDTYVLGYDAATEKYTLRAPSEGGTQGPAGVDGVDGADGLSVLNGSGAPGSEVGVDGEFYIDTTAHAIYGPKTSGAWGTSTSLVGPQGETGTAGTDGATGAQGPQGEQGPQGPAGAAGVDGVDGADGRTVLSGTIAPTTEGEDGDFYIDTATSTLYGPKAATWPTGVSLIGPQGETGETGAQGPAGADGADGAQGPQGEPGATGAAGADGLSVLSGSGAPGSGIGVDGDWYIDTAAHTIYGPKTSGSWGSPTSLVGPQGETGIAGTDGDDGAPGADGKTVLNGTVDPTTEGALGDFYVNTTAHTIFGPKGEGGWGAGTSLIGPQGETGPAGADGEDGTGTTATQVTPAAITIAHATTDAAAGKTGSIDLTANHGMVTRLRFRADYLSGQQGSWSALVNQANGYDHDDTSIAFDGAVGTLTAGKYVKWGEEICLVGGSGTISTPVTLTRGQKGTTATFHPDNEQIVLLNDGVRLEFYPNSSYLPSERLFAWDGIMTGVWTTSASISAGANVLYTTADPTTVSDFGFDSLILIDDTTDEVARVAAVFGDVANNSYDKSIFVQGTLAAHDTTKTVYRLHQFDVPIPFKFATSATTLYVKMYVDEAITGTVTGTLEVIADKWS